MEKNINSEDIQKEITQAIVNSAFGEKLTTAVKNELDGIISDRFWHSDKSIVKRALENEIETIAHNWIRENLKNEIEKAIEKKITKDLIERAVDSMKLSFERNY